ncbi:doublecortin domain-containing protein 2 isoform X3 [Engystomops pustulosus]|uniref:doublecortin domain-containing protein 2 isoform X3 n=1 Tax=Engystomops pustulosus TaxID=76066 RepID=UPI003AFA8270
MQPPPVAANGGRTLVPLAQQPAVKAVHVYRNGDPFYRGRRVLIHEKRVGNFDIFLKDVTGKVQAPFGAVRNIYTPRSGHRVTSLEDLQAGEHYVAGGRETFKKLDYLHIGENKKKTLDPLIQSPIEDVKPVSHSRINVSARFRKNVQEPITVFLIANGDTMNPVMRLLIPRKVLDQWELVLAMVTDKVKLRSGAVHRLYTLEGIPVNDGSELEYGQIYVAVGRDKFKKLPYTDLLFSKSSVRRVQGKSKENRHERHTKSTGGSADNGDHLISPQPPKAKPKGNPETQILNKPVRVKQKKELNNNVVVYQENASVLDKTTSDLSGAGCHGLEDRSNCKTQTIVILSYRLSSSSGIKLSQQVMEDDGIFKAGEDRSEMWGASEVQEDENTKVEVPVDQRVAEPVEEEEVRDNEGQDGEVVAEEAEEHEYVLNNVQAEHLHEEETGENEEHSMVSHEVEANHGKMLNDSEDVIDNYGDGHWEEDQHVNSVDTHDGIGHVNGDIYEREEEDEDHVGNGNDQSQAEDSLPRPTSSRLLEKVSTPSEDDNKESVAVA